MVVVQTWCRVTVLGREGAELAHHVIEGSGAADIGAVDEVARLALRAVRLGGVIVLSGVSPGLRELLELAGLDVEVEG